MAQEHKTSERTGLLSQDYLEDPGRLANPSELSDGLTPEEEFKYSSSCARMDDVYLPWAICGRQLHWSEGVLLGAVGISLGCLVLWGSGLRLPATLYSLILTALSILSLWMVWGVAQVKTFAKLASALESEQGRIEAVTEGLREQNNRVHEATLHTRAQMTQVARDLGLFEGGLEDLDAVQRGLRSFAETMAEHQHEQHILNAAQKEKILREHEIHRDERARQCRDRIIEWFDSAADKRVFVDTPQQHKDLMEVLEASDLLRDLQAEGRDWRRRVAGICRNGVTEKWELIDLVDELANTEYHQITQARERRKELEAKLARVRAELQRASRR